MTHETRHDTRYETRYTRNDVHNIHDTLHDTTHDSHNTETRKRAKEGSGMVKYGDTLAKRTNGGPEQCVKNNCNSIRLKSNQTTRQTKY